MNLPNLPKIHIDKKQKKLIKVKQAMTNKVYCPVRLLWKLWKLRKNNFFWYVFTDDRKILVFVSNPFAYHCKITEISWQQSVSLKSKLFGNHENVFFCSSCLFDYRNALIGNVGLWLPFLHLYHFYFTKDYILSSQNLWPPPSKNLDDIHADPHSKINEN